MKSPIVPKSQSDQRKKQSGSEASPDGGIPCKPLETANPYLPPAGPQTGGFFQYKKEGAAFRVLPFGLCD